MDTVVVSADTPDAVQLGRAVALLRAGELLIYPTDTLYAIGGRALDARVAEAVRAAKGRAGRKPLPLIAADTAQARGLVRSFPKTAAILAERFWPGPLSLVLAASDEIPEAVSAGLGTVAVRVPGLPLARMLCAQAGPLISSSANRSGAGAPLSCAVAVEAVGRAAAMALDAGPAPSASASTIVEIAPVGSVRLIRPGAVPWAAVQEAVGSDAC
jgi:L-threonylcarbamoyladenylate synthase